jgi:hypothetical protein
MKTMTISRTDISATFDEGDAETGTPTHRVMTLPSLARTDHRSRRRRRVGNLGVTRQGEVVFGTAPRRPGLTQS